MVTATQAAGVSISRRQVYTFKIILTQGLNRQIRRMCECFGYKVKQLTRIRVMNICLGELKKGEYREIKGLELRELYDMCGMTLPDHKHREAGNGSK